MWSELVIKLKPSILSSTGLCIHNKSMKQDRERTRNLEKRERKYDDMEEEIRLLLMELGRISKILEV